LQANLCHQRASPRTGSARNRLRRLLTSTLSCYRHSGLAILSPLSLTDRAVRSAGGFVKLLETSVLGFHLIDSDVDRSASTVDHHVPGTWHTVPSVFTYSLHFKTTLWQLVSDGTATRAACRALPAPVRPHLMLHTYTLCLKKNTSNIFCCNSSRRCWILIIFGIGV